MLEKEQLSFSMVEVSTGSDLRGTIQALPEVITIMRKRGYSFVTVPQLLQVSKNK